MTQQELKKKAAEKAVELLRDNMVLGLGTGSTTMFALEFIAEKIKDGSVKGIKGIPTSKATEKRAIELGIPLTDFEQHPLIDLTIDGADEVDENLNLIKGGGGALLKEKVVAQASKEEVIIVDSTKLSANLGEKWAVPVEVVPFAYGSEKNFLESLGAKVVRRTHPDGSLYLTDENNIILDANFGVIDDPEELAAEMELRAGIVEHGLFIELASRVISANEDGITILEK